MYDLAVIGGGILGLSHAAAAAARGLRTLVLERHPQTLESSVRNFGLLTSLYDAPGLWGSRSRRSREIYESWSERSGGGVPLSRTGSLQLAQSKSQWDLLQAYNYLAPHLGYPVSLLDSVEASKMVPSLCQPGQAYGRIYGALHFPNDALLEPRLMFSRLHGLPALLSREPHPVEFKWSSPVVGLKGASGGSGVVLTTAAGDRVVAGKALVCSGTDVRSLLPSVFHWEGANLRVCKLQMMRVATPLLPSHQLAPSLSPITVTSGLSLRRYPGPAALLPKLHTAMLKEDEEGSDPVAEGLGIHIIARPAAIAQSRTAFGGLSGHFAHTSTHTQPTPITLSPNEWVIGDSHEYAPATGDTPSPMDETCDEGVTTEILRVAGTMLRGIGELAEHRRGGKPSSTSSTTTSTGSATILSQWSGLYLDHKEGLMSVDCVVDEQGRAERAPGSGTSAANVHVVTGIGGKGMTMSPALGEEWVKEKFFA